ncbi:cell envelope integrity protein TolA [Candidatus Harpocratesius sp.]
MVSIRIEFMISIGLIIVYYIYLLISQFFRKKQLNESKFHLKQSFSEDQTSSSTKLDESETLDDLLKEREMVAIQEQIAQVENTISESISSTPVIISPLAIQPAEEQLISEGERLYSEFNEDLFDATPRTSSEQQIDLQNLMHTIESLESLDLSHYHPDENKKIDMGVGMFYDSISQKLQKIIKNREFKKLPFIQAEKLESYALQTIKNLSHDNFRETLKIMKEVEIIKEIVLINEMTTLLNFSNIPIDLSVPEKVIFFYMANNFPTTFKKILKFTQWKSNYLNEIIDGLIKKQYIYQNDDVLIAPGLISEDEFQELHSQFEKIEQIKREKELKAAKLAEEKLKFEQSLKEKQKKKEKIRIKEKQDKMLQEARLKAKKEAENARKVAEKLTEQEELERIKKIKSMPRPKIQTLPKKTKTVAKEKTKLSSFMKSNPEFDDMILIVQQTLENFKKMTGGLIVFQALQYYCNQEGIRQISDEKWKDLIEELKIRKIFLKTFEQSGVQVFIYEKIGITDEMEILIKQFILHGEMNYNELEQALGWSIKKLEGLIKFLYEHNLIKYNQREKFYFPGLFNTK